MNTHSNYCKYFMASCSSEPVSNALIYGLRFASSFLRPFLECICSLSFTIGCHAYSCCQNFSIYFRNAAESTVVSACGGSPYDYMRTNVEVDHDTLASLSRFNMVHRWRISPRILEHFTAYSVAIISRTSCQEHALTRKGRKGVYITSIHMQHQLHLTLPLWW
jgi:hypothetical protein